MRPSGGCSSSWIDVEQPVRARDTCVLGEKGKKHDNQSQHACSRHTRVDKVIDIISVSTEKEQRAAKSL